jgi:deoxyribodipyrimidine photo-lyase
MNIFIHRRDLRHEDNNTLLKMNEKYNNITPIFIFNPNQIYPEKNKYFSNNLVQFLIESLIELYESYKKKKIFMQFFEGEIIAILNKIHKKHNINSIGFNRDYSPFSKSRDNTILKWCNKHSIEVFNEEDMLLSPINSGNSLNPNTQKPYVVYTPFMKNLMKFDVDKLNKKKVKFNITTINISELELKKEQLNKFYIKNPDIHVKSGRKNGIEILKNISKLSYYDTKRNDLSYSTTNLSAYINMGVLSIREVFFSVKNSLGKNNGLIRELYWREFYYNILNYFPHVIGNSFKENYDKIKWKTNKKHFEAWKNGTTGFPVVDAAMTQLNSTGYMHNRGRMIVASFLTKDLMIDWMEGEKYFATKLVDYNMSANNGGWQWAAGTGTDAQPYFRIFNPWTQSEKFDPNCTYIKKWLPVLKDVSNKHIHNWNKYCNDYNIDYNCPIIEHDKSRKQALDLYKKYL